MKKLLTIVMLLSSTLLLNAQESFVRSALIDPPATFGSGFGATVSGVDLDGDGKVEIYSVNGMSDFNNGDEIPQIIKYEFNGTSWDSVWAASFPDERQNTWAALTTGDLDGDGKMEVIWGFVNSFSTNATPPRVVVFENQGDDLLGVSDGAGNFTPNAQWDMDVPESTNMRPLKWVATDIDNDGTQEVVFAERRDYYNLGIISTSDVPDNGDGSETWTMEFNKNTELYNKFVRSGQIESPDGGFGNVVSGVDLDNDGLMDLYGVNDDWSDGTNGELIPTMYKYELVHGAWVLRWSTVVPDIPLQNTWPVLAVGDLDNDGLGEVVFCPANNLGTGNEDPYRIVVYETAADSSDMLGVDMGDGTYAPNARWNMGVPPSTEMRPFSGTIADVDNDGVQEFVFGERRAYYGWGVVSVSDVPNNGDGSEVWTMEAAGMNNYLKLYFEDDSDVANWDHYDEGNVYTTEAFNDTAGVNGSGALELGDGGYAFLDKRPVSTKAGKNFELSVDIKTEGWGDPATYPLYLIVEGFADSDSVLINSDSGYTHFTLSGTATGTDGYIKIAGSNTAGQNYVWVDNLIFNDGEPTPYSSSLYHNIAVDGTDIFVFRSDGNIFKIDGANGYDVVSTQVNPVAWNFRSNNNAYDIDNDGNMEFVVGDYSSGGTHAAWVFTQDGDTLKGGIVADFTGNTASRVTGITIGDIDGDGNADILAGFRGSDAVYRAEYNGTGDILDAANYTVSVLDQGVLNAPNAGQIDIIVAEDIDGDGSDEVFYAGPPRSLSDNKLQLTIGHYSDTLTADAGRRWDMVVANGKAHFFNGSGDIQTIAYEDSGWVVYPSQPGVVNGAFLTASAADINGDGVEEVFVGDWYDAKVQLLEWSNGAWVAHEAWDFADVGGNRLNGGAVGDVDGDGNIEFVTGSRQSTPNGQIYRVEYLGGDFSDPASFNGEVIDQELNTTHTQYEVVNVANLDDDPELEVVYTSDYARGSATAADPQVPLVILDVVTVQTTPIADVRVDANGDFVPDNLGQEFTIDAVVTSPRYSFSSLQYYVQDATGGIYLYQGGNDSTMLDIGDRVQVTGTVDQYNGLTEFVVSNIVPLGLGSVPEPVELTAEEFNAKGEEFEGQLVKIKGVGLMDGTWPASGSNANLDLWDGFYSFTARIDKDTEVDENPEPTWPVDIVGIVGQYDSSDPRDDGYQLMLRMYDDITQGVDAAPNPHFFFSDDVHANVDGSVAEVTDVNELYPLDWHPAVDLNGDPLLYQVIIIDDQGNESPYLADNNGQDTVLTFTGQDLIDMLNGADSAHFRVTVMTTSQKPTEPIVASVDTISVSVVDLYTGVDELIPKKFFVDQNYPNPFNPSTTIRFGLPQERVVDLRIYDILGREVATLVNNKMMKAGVYEYYFNASNLASGTYIYRLTSGNKIVTKKMMLIK